MIVVLLHLTSGLYSVVPGYLHFYLFCDKHKYGDTKEIPVSRNAAL